MSLTWPDRLIVERRLLAALYLWPRQVDLEPRHFISPAHGALYAALEEAGDSIRDDYQAIPILRAMVQRDALDALFCNVRGIENYVMEQLIPTAVTEAAIPDLVSLVRECPRCGR